MTDLGKDPQKGDDDRIAPGNTNASVPPTSSGKKPGKGAVALIVICIVLIAIALFFIMRSHTSGTGDLLQTTANATATPTPTIQVTEGAALTSPTPGVTQEVVSSPHSGDSTSSTSGSGTSGSGDSGSSSNSGSSSSDNLVHVSVSVSSDAAGGGVSGSANPTFEQGVTAYDALCATGLSVNASSTQYGIYVSAIGGLAERQYGSGSGWVFEVNDSEPSVACSSYVLSDGDSVNWIYITG